MREKCPMRPRFSSIGPPSPWGQRGRLRGYVCTSIPAIAIADTALLSLGSNKARRLATIWQAVLKWWTMHFPSWRLSTKEEEDASQAIAHLRSENYEEAFRLLWRVFGWRI